MGTIKRAFWAVDRRLGGARPPLRPRGRFIRHPVICGLAAAVFFGGLAAGAIGRVEPPIVLYALAMGACVVLLVIAERKRLDHYGHP